MGKRELVLIVVLVFVGAGLYQVTAPAAPADAPGFSLTRIFELARAHVRGARERRTVTRTAVLAGDEQVQTLDVSDFEGTVTVSGSDRQDIEANLEATLAGVDEADLAAQEQALQLDLSSTGGVAMVTVAHSDTARRPRQILRIDVPARLTVKLGGKGRAEVRAVAGLVLADYRGDLIAEDLEGPVTGEYRDGKADFGPGAILQLRTSHGRLRADEPASVSLETDRTQIEILDPSGAVTLDQQWSRIDIRGTGGPVKVTGEGGVINLRDVRHPLEIDAERLSVSAELDAAVPVTIAIENDFVELSLSSAGVQLDLSCESGDLRVPRELTPVTDGERQYVTASLGGGGPLVKVEVIHGDLTVRARGL